MLVNVTVLSESKGPSSSWHRQLTTIPPTNQKHSNLRHAFKPPSAGSPQSFNPPTISSSADRVRPAPLLLAALRSQTTPPYCCPRREAPTICQVSETPDDGSPISERISGRAQSVAQWATPLALRRQGARRQFKHVTFTAG